MLDKMLVLSTRRSLLLLLWLLLCSLMDHSSALLSYIVDIARPDYPPVVTPHCTVSFIHSQLLSDHSYTFFSRVLFVPP